MVDNGSSDNTVQVANQYPVRIYHCERRGIGPPRNLGLKMANGNIVCFTDSDCVVEKEWLRKISSFFEQNSEADGVGGPVFPYPLGQSKVQKLTGEIFVEDQRYPRETKKLQFGSMDGIIFGSNSAYKKAAIVSAGGYPEPGGSNLELVWKLTSMNRNLFFNPDIKVNHIFPHDLRSIFKQHFRWGAQLTNMKRIYHKDKGAKEVVYITYLPLRRLVHIVFHREVQRELLHLVQAASYSLGRIYGIRS